MNLSDAPAVYFGTQAVLKVYSGSTQVWPVEEASPNLIVNGDFSENTNGWSVGNGGVLSVSGGALKLTKGSASNCFTYQSVPVIAGKTYNITVEVLESIGNTGIRLGTGPAQLQYLNSGAYGPRLFTTQFTAPSTSNLFLSIVYISSTIGDYGLYDNISITEV
jgi:hypothetical protein